MKRINALSEIAENYDAVLCDVWGVLHNGKAAWPEAVSALSRFHREYGPVIMITNAPRPNGAVIEQLQRLKVPDQTFDRVITSGDVTRHLIGEMQGPFFHIGPERDLVLFEGLAVTLAPLPEARCVICSGLYDDLNETPADYVDLIAEMRRRNLPMICANPDIQVEFGDRMIWCAGAIERDYRAIGGETHIVGKPHRPIYDLAVQTLAEIIERPIDKARILAIGDGMNTDVAGASRYGLDVLYISAGVHAAEYGDPDNPDPARLLAFLEANGQNPVAYMPRLA